MQINIPYPKFNFSSLVPASASPYPSSSQQLQLAIEKKADQNTQVTLAELDTLPGETPNVALPNGELPLCYAIRQENLDMVEWLLKHPSLDLKLKDRQGLTPMDHAFIGSNKDIQQMMVNHCFGTTMIEAEELSNKISVGEWNELVSYTTKYLENFENAPFLRVEELKFFPQDYLDREVSFLKSDKTNFETSYLNCAIAQGNQEAVEFLLSQNVKITGHPLHLAIVKGDIRILKMLLEKGADIDNETFFEKLTPLHYAAITGNFAAFKMLVERGGNVNIQTSRHPTPLSLLITSAKNRDPLKLSTQDLLNFALAVFTCVCSYHFTDISYLQEILLIQCLISLIINCSSLSIFLLPTILSQFSLFQRPLVLIQTGVVGLNALINLTACWRNRNLDSKRAFRNTIIFSTNLTATALTVFNILKLPLYTKTREKALESAKLICYDRLKSLVNDSSYIKPDTCTLNEKETCLALFRNFMEGCQQPTAIAQYLIHKPSWGTITKVPIYELF